MLSRKSAQGTPSAARTTKMILMTSECHSLRKMINGKLKDMNSILSLCRAFKGSAAQTEVLSKSMFSDLMRFTGSLKMRW